MQAIKHFLIIWIITDSQQLFWILNSVDSNIVSWIFQKRMWTFWKTKVGNFGKQTKQKQIFLAKITRLFHSGSTNFELTVSDTVRVVTFYWIFFSKWRSKSLIYNFFLNLQDRWKIKWLNFHFDTNHTRERKNFTFTWTLFTWPS